MYISPGVVNDTYFMTIFLSSAPSFEVTKCLSSDFYCHVSSARLINEASSMICSLICSCSFSDGIREIVRTFFPNIGCYTRSNLVSFAAVFWDVTQCSTQCVTSPKTAAKETRSDLEGLNSFLIQLPNAILLLAELM